MSKLQASGSKPQRSPNFQSPKLLRSLTPPHLRFGTWGFLGVRSLEFGISLMFGAGGLMLLAGCSVGPNYQRPAVESPARFRGDSAPTTNSFADLDWWRVYEDRTLQALVREAFTN